MSVMYVYLAVAGGLLIIAALGVYAGRLLHQLHNQQQRTRQVRQERINKITESIQTIAMAVEQQQCNLSEGSIRLCELLQALPLTNPPVFASEYPALFTLYHQVRELPTHQARKQQPRKETERQDNVREEQESLLESTILKEVAELKGREYAL